MKKSLIALAVLAAAGAASAQSTVTLSGIVKGGLAQTRYTNGPAGTNGSNTALADGSSRFILSGREDLGGGLAAVFQSDTRWRVDDNGGAPTASPLATGNTFVGLAGGFGQIRLGKLDTHYSLGSDEHGSRATALSASSCALLCHVGGVGSPIANASRTVNALRYDLPGSLMTGLTGSVTYSTGFSGNDGAMGAASDGRAIAAALGYAAGPLALGASVWNGRAEDRTTFPRNDQQAWTLHGSWNFGFAKVGLTYDRSTYERFAAAGAPGIDDERSVWSIPVTVGLGAGTLLFTYTRASTVERGGADIAGSGARLWSIGYDHALSKRTSVGVSYANLNNGAAATYQLYTSNSLISLPVVGAGQDQRQVYVGVRHTF
ncbi:MAG TPA: porin [Ramlibacter sp.]|nr:porin [Ramlibacter sp.]